MRKLNSSAILDLIREHGPIARAEISRKLNMSIPTVMRIIECLMEEGMVRWSGNAEATGGRPRYTIEFNGKGHAVLGLDLGGSKMFGTVADLSGHIYEEIYIPWHGVDAHESLARVCELIERLLAVPRPAGQKILGIGVGAPGVTLLEEGIVTWAPSLGWRDLPLKQILNDKFNLPVVVENDVNLVALGEYGFGAGRGASNLVCIFIGTGIGAGIIVDRKIYHGFHQSAGEVGYLPYDVSCLGKRYDAFGALEGIASGRGIGLRATQWFEAHDRLLPEGGLTAEDVFNAARAGEIWAKDVVAETVDYLALATATIAAIIDPEVIIMGGGVARSADILIPPILEKLDGVLPSPIRLVQSPLGSRAAVMGAIMLVLDTTTEHVALMGQ